MREASGLTGARRPEGGRAVLEAEVRGRLAASFRTLRAVYWAMLGSLGLYWLVVMVTRKVGSIPSGRGAYAEMDWLRYPLFVVGAGLAVLTTLARRYLLRPAALRQRATAGDPSGYLNAVVSAHVVAYALAEIPAVLGLALYFLGGYLTDFYAMAAFGICAFAGAFPREDEAAALLATLLTAPPAR